MPPPVPETVWTDDWLGASTTAFEASVDDPTYTTSFATSVDDTTATTSFATSLTDTTAATGSTTSGTTGVPTTVQIGPGLTESGGVTRPDPCAPKKDCYAQCKDQDTEKLKACREINSQYQEKMKEIGCTGTKCTTPAFHKNCSKTKRKKASKRYWGRNAHLAKRRCGCSGCGCGGCGCRRRSSSCSATCSCTCGD